MAEPESKLTLTTAASDRQPSSLEVRVSLLAVVIRLCSVRVGGGGSMTDTCVKCGAELAIFVKDCPVCQQSAGFPNVRVAARDQEVEALATRVEAAWASARARGTGAVLAEFEAVASGSQAVMSRRLDAMQDWVTGQSELWHSFHHQVAMGRVPQENGWDEGREAAESTINPYVFQSLNFAALSLDGKGLVSYGPYAVTLADATIEHRATVFEENPFYFNRKHKLYAGMKPPQGYRAVWSQRGTLAVAKLHGNISSDMDASAFPTVLMEDRRADPDCDFIEVHIYGAVNRQSITRVVGQEPTNAADRLIWKSIRRRLEAQGARVEVT